MKFLSKLTQQLRSFPAHRKGNVALMFGILIPPLIAVTGSAIDYSSALNARDNLRISLDAATIGASIEFRKGTKDKEKLKEVAQNLFEANFKKMSDSTAIIDELTFEPDLDTGKVTGHAKLSVQTAFLSIVGVDQISFDELSVVSASDSEIVVDIVMCIDATGSMGNTIAAVKANALQFDERLRAELVKRNREVSKIRVRPIYFRDYSVEGPAAVIESSQFFALPEERNLFQSFVSPQVASGGGDEPESGLECLYKAMNSSWTVSSKKKQVYPIVAIWSDANHQSPSHSASRSNGGASYPASMPTSYAGLEAVWEDDSVIDQENKVLTYFGPGKNWSRVSTWEDFHHGGSLSTGNSNMFGAIAEAIAKKLPPIHFSG